MTTFITYRNGKAELPQRLQDAVAHFYAQRHELPDLVIVHTSELTEARAATEALELAVEVRASGGCLVPEVWLVPKEKAGGLAGDAVVTE